MHCKVIVAVNGLHRLIEEFHAYGTLSNRGVCEEYVHPEREKSVAANSVAGCCSRGHQEVGGREKPVSRFCKRDWSNHVDGECKTRRMMVKCSDQHLCEKQTKGTRL